MRLPERYKGLGWRMLSVRQPWAWAIVNGLKDVENRTWSTGYRGPLVIHAGKQPYEDYLGACDDIERISGYVPPHHEKLPFGAIVGLTYVIGCDRERVSPWCIDGHVFWRLAQSCVWPAIPWQGAQGLIQLNEDECHDLCVRLEAAGCAS